MIRHAHLWETLQDHSSPETSEHGGVAKPFNVKPSQIALFLVKFHAKYSGRTDLRERRRNGFTITAFDAVVNTGEEIAPWFEAWPSCEMWDSGTDVRWSPERGWFGTPWYHLGITSWSHLVKVSELMVITQWFRVTGHFCCSLRMFGALTLCLSQGWGRSPWKSLINSPTLCSEFYETLDKIGFNVEECWIKNQ